jgi:ABC-type multidrug transport system ATPase subunit
MQSTKTLKIDGTILVGGAKIDPVEFKRNIAYVMQDDAISPTSTVREALTFSASLRLGGGKSKDEIAEIVNKVRTIQLTHSPKHALTLSFARPPHCLVRSPLPSRSLRSRR